MTFSSVVHSLLLWSDFWVFPYVFYFPCVSSAPLSVSLFVSVLFCVCWHGYCPFFLFFLALGFDNHTHLPLISLSAHRINLSSSHRSIVFHHCDIYTSRPHLFPDLVISFFTFSCYAHCISFYQPILQLLWLLICTLPPFHKLPLDNIFLIHSYIQTCNYNKTIFFYCQHHFVCVL